MSVPSGSIDSIIEASLNTLRVRRACQMISRANQWLLFTIALVGNDILLTAIAFAIAFWARFFTDLPIFQLQVVPSIAFYRTLALIFTPLWLVVFYFNGLYQRRNLLGGTHEYSLVFRATSISMLAVIFIGFLNPTLLLARGWLLVAWALSFLLVAGGRFTLRRCVYALRKQGFFISNTIIIGANKEGFSLAEELLSWQTSGLFILGFVDDEMEAGTRAYRRLFNMGTIDQLDSIVRQHDIEEIVVVTSALPREKVVAIFKKYGMMPEVNLRLSSGLYEVVTTNVEIWDTLNVPLVRVNEMRLTGIDRVLKLLLDYVVTITALAFIGPILLLITIAIRFDSPGPAIYRRRVMGKHGRQFDAFKFRTMHVNGDEILDAHPEHKAELERNHKLKDDPRVTRVGRLLRQYSLDEVPQLINVLKRQMSVVGPRMIAPAEMKMYSEWDMNLLTVNPGLTGLWQVSGRSDTSYEERVKLDMRYIRTWTIWADLYILLQTIPAVIKRRGAY